MLAAQSAPAMARLEAAVLAATLEMAVASEPKHRAQGSAALAAAPR